MDYHELDALVTKVYGRTYAFQQQDDCKDRGTHHVSVPVKNPEDYSNNSVPEVINGNKMGVSFEAWLARTPTEWHGNKKEAGAYLYLFWARNFYPSLDMVVNDLHAKGHLKTGEYVIEIDW